LRDVYDALGRPPLLAIGYRSEAPDCLVEQAVNAALDTAYGHAEATLLSSTTTVHPIEEYLADHSLEPVKASQRYLKFQLLRAAASSFCVGYPRMALIPPRLRSV
jgi:hypothetical protein